MSEGQSEKPGVSRREALAGMIAGGVGAMAPAAFAHPVKEHLAHAATVDAAHKAAQAADWKPLFLSTHQSATLDAVAERLIPGSSRAHANRFVDKLLAIEKQETQRKFLDSLSAFEGASLEQFGRPFLRLTDAERDTVLEKLAARAEPDAPFNNLKGWVSGAYYSSEIGMRELGWTGNGFFQSFPGCTHPGGHD